MWGNRIVIPPLLQQRVLNLLHIGNPGINRMKEVARSYTWLPKIDKDIEEKVCMCNNSQFPRNTPIQLGSRASSLALQYEAPGVRFFLCGFH